MAREYIPARGDLVWLSFTPQAGHEQAGHRPALVISPESYNHRIGLALFCPITSKVKGYPFEVLIAPAGPTGRTRIQGAVLSDQVKSLDFRARAAKRIGAAPDAVVAEVLAKIATLVT